MKRSDITDAMVFEAIRAYGSRPFDGTFPPDTLAELGYPVKVTEAKMQQMVRRGLLDYGVSLRTAWIVEEERRVKT